MRLTCNSSKLGKTYYVIRSIKRDGKRSSEVVERLGTEAEIIEKHHCSDPIAWMKAHVQELTDAEQAESRKKVLVPLSTDALVPLEQQNSCHIGYLFLQQIYYQLGLPTLCRQISKRHAFTYDLDSILSRLIYGRVLFPSSKQSCMEQSATLYEPPHFELQHIYRALSVLAEESDTVQAQLYKNSKKIIPRCDGILYYDCTNYFFETESEEGLKQYGVSKEHRPSPLVQMGLFMDKSGLPLAFSISPGNQNEQTTLCPLEKQIQKDFELSRFIVCTDAGLSSAANRKYNNFGERCFVTTQSIKKLNQELKAWALDPTGWHLAGSKKAVTISELEDTAENRKKVFFKQRLIEEYDEEQGTWLNQNLIVTFSLKYALYQKSIRIRQVERAEKLAEKPALADRTGPNDARRFIKKTKVTKDGEVAAIRAYAVDLAAIDRESKYDGFYAVCTNLKDDPEDIIKINQGRWEIEESFRIMKTEFEARPVYLKRDDRIKAHFLTCYIALLIYRILEWRLNNDSSLYNTNSKKKEDGKTRRKFTCSDIIHTLRHMDMTILGNNGYVPAYTRTELTDELHKLAGFRTDYQLSTDKTMKGFCRRSKGL
jgi:transposase